METEYIEIDAHKNALHGTITADTLAREENIKNLISSYFGRINTLTNEEIREKVDALETMLSIPEITGRKYTVDGERIKPGLFILGQSKYKRRPLLVISDNKEKQEVKALRLCSFNFGMNLPEERREREIQKKLMSDEFYLHFMPVSDSNSISNTKHYYRSDEFYFTNGGNRFDGFVDCKLSEIETVPYSEIFRILKPNNSELAKKLYANAIACVKQQQGDRRSEMQKLREALEEKEREIKEVRAEKAKVEKRYRNLYNMHFGQD